MIYKSVEPDATQNLLKANLIVANSVRSEQQYDTSNFF
jgi:hypothetical protein